MINCLPEKLKTLRIQFGLSQKQVAEKLEVSPSIVSGYETGERTPSTENLLSLSYLYNVSTDYLLGRQAADPRSLLDISKLTDKQKAAVTNLIESIIKS
jgi:transcriptional regulator with XRE-family HTH domain